MDEELLRNLTEISAVSGEEFKVHDLINNSLKSYVDEVKSLKNGSIYAVKKGTPGKCSLMLDAHIDEVGLFVTGFTDEGFLRIHSRSIDPKVLPGSIVTVHGKKDLKGVTGLKPYHLIEKNEKAVPINKLYIGSRLEVFNNFPNSLFQNVNSLAGFLQFQRENFSAAVKI
jgi:putative aminopeptidase FrvX